MTASRLDSIGCQFFGGQSIGGPYSAYPQVRKVRSYSTMAMRWRRATVRSLKGAGKSIVVNPRRKARPYRDKKSPPKKCRSALRRCDESAQACWKIQTWRRIAMPWAARGMRTARRLPQLSTLSRVLGSSKLVSLAPSLLRLASTVT
jgi:hypothetical protein